MLHKNKQKTALLICMVTIHVTFNMHHLVQFKERPGLKALFHLAAGYLFICFILRLISAFAPAEIFHKGESNNLAILKLGFINE